MAPTASRAGASRERSPATASGSRRPATGSSSSRATSALEVHHPLGGAAAGLVLLAAVPALAVLPPDPAQVVELEEQQRDDPERGLRLRHAARLARRDVDRNGPV